MPSCHCCQWCGQRRRRDPPGAPMVNLPAIGKHSCPHVIWQPPLCTLLHLVENIGTNHTSLLKRAAWMLARALVCSGNSVVDSSLILFPVFLQQKYLRNQIAVAEIYAVNTRVRNLDYRMFNTHARMRTISESIRSSIQDLHLRIQYAERYYEWVQVSTQRGTMSGSRSVRREVL